MAQITDCLNKGEFEWTKCATKALKEIKKLTTTLVLRLLVFFDSL